MQYAKIKKVIVFLNAQLPRKDNKTYKDTGKHGLTEGPNNLQRLSLKKHKHQTY